jgi:serine/threonine-protein kinase RsbW
MTISQKLPSRIEVIPEFILSVIDKIKSPELREEEIFNIRLSLEEALVNAMKHGNKLNPDLSVAVDIEATANYLKIEIRDQGAGFDFKNLPDPTKNENLEKPGGRGAFLIKKLMDEAEYFDCGRGIRMVKFFSTKGGKK